MPELVAEHQAKLGGFEHRLDDALWLALAQIRIRADRLEGDVNHLVGAEMSRQILHDLCAGLNEQHLKGLHSVRADGLTHGIHLHCERVAATAKLSRRNLQLTEECLPVPAESRPTPQELDRGASF